MTRLHLWLPERLVARIHLHLFSELHGRVPYGRLREFIESAVEARLDDAQRKLNGTDSPTEG
jgi:hypothetical protein